MKLKDMRSNADTAKMTKPDMNLDMPPVPAERLARMKRVALAKFIRHHLAMGQDEFALAYGIPPDTLRAWERHEAEPTPAEIAYLRLIEREPQRARLVPAE